MDLSKFTGFDWDEHNAGKNWRKHAVTPEECEQVFLNEPLVIVDDEAHSKHEKRQIAFGRTNHGRELAMVFTIRDNLIRVISARDMDQKEKKGILQMKKKMPHFKNEDEERDFWASHSLADYVDWSKAKRVVFPNLKPSVKTISLRLPQSMLNEIKVLANKRDVPYQSLLKIFLAERIESEFKRRQSRAAA